MNYALIKVFLENPLKELSSTKWFCDTEQLGCSSMLRKPQLPGFKAGFSAPEVEL